MGKYISPAIKLVYTVDDLLDQKLEIRSENSVKLGDINLVIKSRTVDCVSAI